MDRALLTSPFKIFGHAGGEIFAPKPRDESERQIDSGSHASGGSHTLIYYKSVASPDVDFVFGQRIEKFVMRGRGEIFQNAGRHENKRTRAY